MMELSQGWLLAIGSGAALVIFSSRASAVLAWVKATLATTSTTDRELQLVVNLVEAGSVIPDTDQRSKVREACIACFMGWIASKFPA